MKKNKEEHIYPMRLNKYLAHTNIASRREADRLIEEGKIYINGKKAVLGAQVHEKDIVTLGKKKEDIIKEYRYFAYNKEEGITTNKEKGVKDILSVTMFPVPVFPVGRLDKDSKGLIIMTNDGRITEKLLHPRFFHEKEYRAELNRPVSNTLLRGFKQGVHIGEFHARAVKVKKYNTTTLDIILTEGQNRQIRRMAKAFGYEVVKLTRFRVENILLGDLKAGGFREIVGKEREDFLKTLGL